MNFDSMTVPDYLPGPLWVDENGQRFQNEAFAGPEINGFFMARAKRGNITSIYDSTYETQILRGLPRPSGIRVRHARCGGSHEGQL